VDVVDTGGEPGERGVVHLDPERVQPGLTYFTNTHGCSSQLVGLDGRVFHTWHHEPCYVWGNTALLPNGDVLAVHRRPTAVPSFQARSNAREVIRLDWDGRLLWRRPLPAHHDLELTPDGRVAALTEHHRLMPAFHPSVPIRDHYVVLLGKDGSLLERLSLTDVLLASPEVFHFQEVRPQTKLDTVEIDLLHANSLEWMRRPSLFDRDPIYGASHVLVCLRHQDSVVILDWETRRVVFAWGQGVLSGPHDATLLENGNILLFDNGLDRKRSRVVEIDPLRREIVWEYTAPEEPDFFTVTRGSAQRLPNGNTLITDSEAGRIFEVTREGDVVWDFRNPNTSRKGEPIVVVRARRLSEFDLEAHRFEWTD
jgi:hypothetical protein